MSQVKQLGEDEKNRHGEFLAALYAIEIALNKVASHMTEKGPQLSMGARAPAVVPVAPAAPFAPVEAMPTPTTPQGLNSQCEEMECCAMPNLQ